MDGRQMAVVSRSEKSAEGPVTVGALMEKANLPLPDSKLAHKKVLTEEEYEAGVSQIIERDYYPHVKKMKAQVAYLQAQEDSDVERMREISLEYSRSVKQSVSGALSTPTPNPTITPHLPATPLAETPGGVPGPASVLRKTVAKEEKPMSLTAFFGSHTGEDDASFAVLMAKSQKQHRQQNAWLYEQEEKAKAKTLALQEGNSDQLAITDGSSQTDKQNKTIQAGPTLWDYRAKNSLMYYSDRTESVYSKDDLLKAQSKEIRFDNTRLKENPFKAPLPVKKEQRGLGLENVITGQPAVDAMGVTQIPETPQVRGYRYVSTPSASPLPGQSPLITWGHVEDTPARLDVTDIDTTPGPSYTFPPESAREIIAQSVLLRNKHTKATPRTPASQKHLRSPMPTPHSLGNLSPAARRLASMTLARPDSPVVRIDSGSNFARSPAAPASATPIGFTGTPARADTKRVKKARAENEGQRDTSGGRDVFQEETRGSVTDNLMPL